MIVPPKMEHGSASAARFLSADYTSHLPPCVIPNCTAPGFICFYDGCAPFPFPFPPPPPPPPVPVKNNSNNHVLLTTFLISAASLVALSLLLLFLFHLFTRRRRVAAGTHDHHQQQHPNNNNNGIIDDDDGGGGGGGTHHVWYIRTVGLDESVIKAISVAVYKSGDEGLIRNSGGDCSVCLGEFKDGEQIKLLPNCAHVFHQPCIDTWLRSHVNCPLCRAPVVVDNLQQPNQEDCAIDINLTASESTSSSSSSSSSSAGDQNRVLEPVRRSVSMDCVALGKLVKEIELRELVVAEKRGGNFGVELDMMKRSMSSRSGRIFFPRCGRPARGRSASVLPL